MKRWLNLFRKETARLPTGEAALDAEAQKIHNQMAREAAKVVQKRDKVVIVLAPKEARRLADQVRSQDMIGLVHDIRDAALEAENWQWWRAR